MKNITIKQLRYVEAAGRLKSIASAASECNISQTSVATAVDSLEQEIGFDLFRRAPAKGLQITQAGQEALVKISGLLESARQFEIDIKSISGRHSGLVKAACDATDATMFLPDVMKSFMHEYPDVDVYTVEGNLKDAVELLDKGNADLAFTYQDLKRPHHRFDPLIQTRPFALVPSAWDIANQKDVALNELAQHPMVLLDVTKSNSYLLDMFTARNLKLDIAHRTTSTALIRSLVASEFGFSILDLRRPAEEERYAGYVLLPIRDDVPDRNFGIVSHENVKKPQIIDVFIAVCQEKAKTEAFRQITLDTRFPALSSP